MKFIDEKGRLFSKISIVDIVILLAIIVAVVGVGIRFGGKAETTMPNTTSIVYSLKVESIREATIDMLNKKGKIYDKKTGTEIGEIIDVKSEVAKHNSVKSDGSIVEAELPGRCDAIVTVKTQGKEGTVAIYNNINSEINVGATFNLISKWVDTNGIIQSVDIEQ